MLPQEIKFIRAGGNMTGGLRSIAGMFHYLTVHFHDHEKDIHKEVEMANQLMESQSEPGFRQKDSGFLTYPANAWRKAMFKFPLILWRMGLGPLFGQSMVLFTQTGRKSGLPRRTMTELHVVNGRKYIPSGFGRRAQWYRNLEADPRLTIQTAAGTESAVAVRVIEDDEILALLDHMTGRSQSMTRLYLDSLSIENDEADILAKKDRIYWLRLDPTGEPTPPPQECDLLWIWPAAAALLALVWLAVRKKRR